jgi:hypothetical protein
VTRLGSKARARLPPFERQVTDRIADTQLLGGLGASGSIADLHRIAPQRGSWAETGSS